MAVVGREELLQPAKALEVSGDDISHDSVDSHLELLQVVGVLLGGDHVWLRGEEGGNEAVPCEELLLPLLLHLPAPLLRGGGVQEQALQEVAGIVYRGGVFGHLLLLLLYLLPLELLLLHQVRKELGEGEGEEHGIVLPLLLALLLLSRQGLGPVHGLLLHRPFLPLLLLLPPGLQVYRRHCITGHTTSLLAARGPRASLSTEESLQLLPALPPGLLRIFATIGSLQEVQEVLQLVSRLLDAGHGSALAALPHGDEGGDEGQEAALSVRGRRWRRA